MDRFVEWDSLEVRVDGGKLNAMAAGLIAADPLIESLRLSFANGAIRIEGVARKFIRVPFSAEVNRIEARGTTVRVPLGRVTAGPIPVPGLLLSLGRDLFPKDLVHYEEPATLVFALDRFLPSFVSTEIDKIRIIEAGLAVTLGRGGADLPPGGKHD